MPKDKIPEKNSGIHNNHGDIKGGFLAGVMNFNVSPAEDDDKSLSCAHCGQEADTTDILENGKVKCKKCRGDFFVVKPQTKNTTIHLNVPPDLQNAYSNIIFRIDLKLGEGSYKEADSICDEAIKLCSLTPRGLEYKALCLYFTTLRQEIIANSARKILVYLDHARMIDPTSKNGENIAGSIAFKYYKMLRYRIQNIQNKQTDVNELCKLISEFNTCYKIFPSIQFLKAQINHLSGCEGYCLITLSDELYGFPTEKYKQFGEQEKYLLKDSSSYPNIFQIISTLEKEVKKNDPNYRLPNLQIEYDKRIVGIDTFLLIKEREKEQEERDRIARERQATQARIAREAQEEQDRIAREKQKERDRIAHEAQEEQDRIAYKQQQKINMFVAVVIITIVLIAIRLIYVYWDPIVSFVIGFVKFAIGAALLVGVVLIINAIQSDNK